VILLVELHYITTLAPVQEALHSSLYIGI